MYVCMYVCIYVFYFYDGMYVGPVSTYDECMYGCMHVCPRSSGARAPNMPSTRLDSRSKTSSPPGPWPFCQCSGRKAAAKPEFKAKQRKHYDRENGMLKRLKLKVPLYQPRLNINVTFICVNVSSNQTNCFETVACVCILDGLPPSMLEPGTVGRAGNRLGAYHHNDALGLGLPPAMPEVLPTGHRA